jgi:hypothetical protein
MRLVAIRLIVMCALVGMYAFNATAGVVMLLAGYAYTIYRYSHEGRSHAGA